MRQLSATSLAKISQRYGAEPILVIGVNWFDLANNQAAIDFYGPSVANAMHAGEQFYADKSLPDVNVPGKVLSVNAVEDVTDLSGTTTATNISITLDDTDGTLKTIFDFHDIHKRQCNIYQYFEGIPFGEKFIIYEGVIESPITYSDNDRTLQFSLVSLSEHTEVGFSPEEGQFPNLPADTIGQAWPMAFGVVNKVPGLTYQYPANGTILYPYYHVDPSLDVFDESQNPDDPANRGTPGSQTFEAIPRQNYGAQGEIVATPQFSDAQSVLDWTEQSVDSIMSGANGSFQYSQHLPTVSEALNQAASDLAQALDDRPPPGLFSFIIDGQEYDEHDYILQLTITRPTLNVNADYANLHPQQNQSAYANLPEVKAELKAKGARSDGVQLLNGGIGFPVGIDLIVEMNNHVFTGNMNSSGFMKLKALKLPKPKPAYWAPTGENTIGDDTPTGPIFITPVISNTVYFAPDGSFTPDEYKKHPPKFIGQGEVSVGWKLQQGLVSDGFQLYDAGTQITILGDHSVDYIVNIVPTTIHDVWGFKAVGNTKQLAKVPRARWTHQQVSFTDIDSGLGVTAEIVRLNRLLSAYPGEVWDDGIFVDQTSSVGPNPVDIMSHIIRTYTPDILVDTFSFQQVAPKLANYPMNFFVADKPEVLGFLQDIAYQCRCALFVKNRMFYLKYLSAQPDIDDTITIDDVIEGSISIGTTETEQLTTRLQGQYQADYSTGITSSVIVRNNIQRYGLWNDEHNFFCYTEKQYVQKSVTYWAIMRSNIWKTVKFSTNLNKLNLETFDHVTFDIPGIVAIPAIPIRITSTQYNSEDNRIDFEAWCPVLLGTMLEYEWGYPADSETDFTPLYLRDFDQTAFQDFRQHATGILATVPGQQSNSSDNGGFDSVGAGNGLPGTGNQAVNFTDPTLRDTGEPTPSDKDDQLAKAEGPLEDLVEPLNLPETDANYGPDGKINARRKPLKLLQAINGVAVPGTIMNKVTDGSAAPNTYNVQVYPNGLGKNPQLVRATQLQILNAETIPNGTWVFVSQITVDKTGDASRLTNNFEYYMQVPVWLGQIENEDP